LIFWPVKREVCQLAEPEPDVDDLEDVVKEEAEQRKKTSP
jgi:hypothetical protein